MRSKIGGKPPRTAPRSRLPVVVVLVVAVWLGGVLAGVGIGMARPPETVAMPTASPSAAVSATPASSQPPETRYDAVFSGDPTGVEDVTDQLKAFLDERQGEHVALAVDGVYKVTQVSFTAQDLTVDFRGARLVGVERGAYGILVIRSGRNVVLNDPWVVGTGYEWIGGDDNPDQWEHGIEIDGGSNVTLNTPRTRDVRGDGIYVGFVAGTNAPATGVVINNPNLVRSSRNGIAPVAGEVTILGGTIHDSGLHGVDFEPNNDEGALSIVGVVRGVDIRRAEGLDVFGLTGYAVAAAGYSTATKPSLIIENLTGDELDMRIHDTAEIIIRGNVSDTLAGAYLVNPGNVVFADNVRIRRP